MCSRGTNSGNRLHPTQKPLGILTPIIESFSRPEDVVMDPFCGSGSTLLAAKLAGRRFLGIEFDEHYCNVARDRLWYSQREFTRLPCAYFAST